MVVAAAVSLYLLLKNLTAREELRRKRAASGRKRITDMCDDDDKQAVFTMLDMEDGEKVSLKLSKQDALEMTWEAAMQALADDALPRNVTVGADRLRPVVLRAGYRIRGDRMRSDGHHGGAHSGIDSHVSGLRARAGRAHAHRRVPVFL